METTWQSVIDRWGVFSLVNVDLLSRVACAFVFGAEGNEALLVTSEDAVYTVGGSNASYLPEAQQRGCGAVVKLDALCGRQVVDVACGNGPHLLALTASGDLYTWGSNTHCQLGNGNTNQLLLLPVLSCLVKVRGVACGGNHSLALTQDGEVYAWGLNNCGQIGLGTTVNQPTPRRLAGPLTNRPVALVACCQASSFAVSEGGEPFAWGCNKHAQLGIGPGANQSSPVRIDAMAGQFVSKLACGQSHALALTDEGAMFAWGSNGYGQLACKDSKPGGAFAPVRVLQQRGRFIDIGAVHYSNTSAGMTETGLVLAWGQCRGQAVGVPLETRFLSVNDVFASLSDPPVTCKRLEFRPSNTVSVSQSIQAAFNDAATADVAFLVDGNVLHAHRSLLRIRCEHFRTMFSQNWSEGRLNQVAVQDFSFSVYKAFLEFLYTDKITLSPEEAIGLLDLANCYCESPLKSECERLIRNSITVDNALLLYSAAIKYSAAELQKFCFEFAIHHLSRVVGTEAFAELDDGTLKSLMRQAAAAGAFKY